MCSMDINVRSLSRQVHFTYILVFCIMKISEYIINMVSFIEWLYLMLHIDVL